VGDDRVRRDVCRHHCHGDRRRVQLKHIRSSNQIAILNEFRQAVNDPAYVEAIQFVLDLDAKLEDPAFRAQLEVIPLSASGLAPLFRTTRPFENFGCFVKRGMLEADLICALWANVIYATWRSMAQAVVIMRRSRGDQAFAHFEYLAYLSKQWIDRHEPVYPKDLPRLAPPDRYLVEDRKAAAPTRS